jgi:hypothetical protein
MLIPGTFVSLDGDLGKMQISLGEQKIKPDLEPPLMFVLD